MNALLNRKIIFERVGDIWGPSKRLTRELIGGSIGVHWCGLMGLLMGLVGVSLAIFLGLIGSAFGSLVGEFIRGPWGSFSLITIYIGIVCTASTAKQFLTKGERKLILTYR